MNEFDIKASGWDLNDMHWKRSEAIANEILKIFPLNKQMTALEYGAGTGITSFILKDYLKEITLMDNSTEMVNVTKQKIHDAKVDNLKVLKFDLELNNYTDQKFDLIFTQMVLHHVNDVENVIKKFCSLLNPGGFLAIADLYPEDGSFHGDGFKGHKGFNISYLSNFLLAEGMTKINHGLCFVINKKISESETRQFNVFLLTAASL